MNPLEEKAYIFGSIFALSNKLQLLGDKLDPQLTVKQWLLLAGITKCKTLTPTITEVAALIGSSRQNVKKMALILEKQGFVLLNKDASDARMLRVSLSPSCMAHLKEREKMELDFIEKLFNGFGIQELSAFSGLIKRLEKNVHIMGQQYDEGE